jgi:hypothetical protein
MRVKIVKMGLISIELKKVPANFNTSLNVMNHL